jgi:glyoxylase-like metal-dependent hydrolase (beta-lactamase superfamily II)
MTKDFDLGRRELFAAAALAVGAAAMPTLIPSAARAQAAAPSPMRPRQYRFTLGSFEVTTLSDGMRAGDGPYPTFGGDQEEAAVHALMAENFLPTSTFVTGFTPTLVNTGTDMILFDTGLGEGARGGGMGRLTAQLGEAGVSPADITIVVLTHMHPDHIGGLMEGGAPVFPNARYVTGETEYDFWTDAARATGGAERVHGMVNALVKPFAEKMTFVKPGASVVSGIDAHAAFGHTPGHMAYHLQSEGRRLMLTVDAANHYVASLQRPDWHVRFDMDKAAAAATRKELFGMIAADKVPFIGYHMPFPAVGYLVAKGEGFAYMPATYQFEL